VKGKKGEKEKWKARRDKMRREPSGIPSMRMCDACQINLVVVPSTKMAKMKLQMGSASRHLGLYQINAAKTECLQQEKNSCYLPPSPQQTALHRR